MNQLTKCIWHFTIRFPVFQFTPSFESDHNGLKFNQLTAAWSDCIIICILFPLQNNEKLGKC